MSVWPRLKMVCAATKSLFTRPVLMMWLAIALRMERSVCGVNTMPMSARSNERCSKVESTATRTCGAESRRSVTRVHRIGCISAMLEPHSTKASVASMSS